MVCGGYEGIIRGLKSSIGLFLRKDAPAQRVDFQFLKPSGYLPK